MTTPVTRLQFTDTAPLEAQLASALALPTYRLLGTRTWLSAQHSDFESVTQGWKLHVSARPSTLLVTLARALPVLVARRCSFKVARSIDVLREINSAGSPPGTVGKAVTVYPPQNEVREVASELADALAGFEGPRIRSDRKLRPDSPVYYRYGPIVARFRAQDNGEFEPVLTAPDGTVTSGIAGPSYTVPDWTSDPFSTSSPLAAAGPAAANGDGYPVRRLGGRYQVTSGISRAARGMICRAQDITTGRKVVIKQACSHIGEDTDGADIRDHLRNERRILEALSGLPGVPDFVDHFAHSDSEFLVVSDVGDLNLRQDVADFGTYSPSNRVERSLSRLAASVLSLLDAAHQRGVIVRDLAPKNIIVSESGDLRLIDFEISRLGDVQRYGWTPGFSVLGQRVDADATIEDDYFSLGATLAYAATGMEPICIDQNFACNVAKTLRVLADVQPNTDIVDVIAGLLDPDQQRRREAAAVIRRGSHASAGGRYLVLRSDSVESTAFGTGILADDVVDDVVRHTVRKLVGAVHELVRSAESYPRSTSAYLGSAGMGMELLHHRDGSGVPEALAELAEWTMKREPTLDRPRGLYFGNMGTAIFLGCGSSAVSAEGCVTCGFARVLSV